MSANVKKNYNLIGAELAVLKSEIISLPDIEVKRRLGLLTPREEQILRWRLGIGTDKLTLQEIGERVCITRERVRQVEFRAAKKMLGLLPTRRRPLTERK